jgi:hypothetical protein
MKDDCIHCIDFHPEKPDDSPEKRQAKVECIHKSKISLAVEFIKPII